jgi:hypothetical protein
MDKVRLALVLITIAITLGPFLGVLIVYRNNLSELIIPPEMNQLLNGGQGISDVTGNTSGQSGQTDNQTSDIVSFIDSFLSGDGPMSGDISQIIPEPPVIQYDPITRTFTATFEMNNTSPFNMTLKSINGTVECDEHHFPIGPVQLKEPVTLKAGEISTVTITGQWSEEGINHLETYHAGQQNVSCSLVNAVISATTTGITINLPAPDSISLGEIPLRGS